MKFLKKKIKKLKSATKELFSGDRPLHKRIFNRTQRREFHRMRLIGFTNLWRIRRRRLNKHVHVDSTVLAYTERLADIRFTSQMLGLRTASEKMENSELQIDITEASFLKLLVRMTGAHQILEIGTFRGWSTAILAEGLLENELENGPLFKQNESYHVPLEIHGGDVIEEQARRPMVTTIELRPEEAKQAEELWGIHLNPMVLSRINMLLGDAEVVLSRIVAEQGKGSLGVPGAYELIFIDANKSQYEQYVSSAKKIIRPGGLIIIDNVLNAGLVATSAKDRTSDALRRLNFNVFNDTDPSFEPVMIPAWDGVVVIRRKF